MTKTNDFLEKEGLGRLMRKYTVPCVISLLAAALYNMVDQLYIANADYLGSYGNAANTVVFPMTVIAMALAMMIGDGCCTFVSLSLGRGERDCARRGVGSSIISVTAAGVILAAVYLVFSDGILALFGAKVSGETFKMAKEYFFWISIGIPFYMFSQAMNPIIRSDGSPRFAMATLLVGAAINIVLDPILIFVIPLGMTGAAIATIFGQFVAAVMSAVYLARMKALKLDRDSYKFRFGLMRKILPLGLSSFLAQISIVFSMAAVLNMVTKYGKADPIFSLAQYAHIPTAVMGIVMKFFQIIMSVAIGLSAGCIPIFGYNIGAGRNDRVIKLMKMLLCTEALFGAAACMVFMIFPKQIAGFFGAANESAYYMDFSVRCIRIFLSMTVLSCVNKGTEIFMQAIGSAKTAAALSMLREIVFGTGLPLVLPLFFGLNGIVFFMPAADILTFIASAAVTVHTYRKLLR